MSNPRKFKFSTSSIVKKATPPPADGKAKDVMYFDTVTKGFGIRVGRARPNGEPPTRTFFAKVQNKLHFAIHGQTAAELIVERADSRKPHMGLATWENAPAGKILSAGSEHTW